MNNSLLNSFITFANSTAEIQIAYTGSIDLNALTSKVDNVVEGCIAEKQEAISRVIKLHGA